MKRAHIKPLRTAHRETEQILPTLKQQRILLETHKLMIIATRLLNVFMISDSLRLFFSITTIILVYAAIGGSCKQDQNGIVKQDMHDCQYSMMDICRYNKNRLRIGFQQPNRVTASK